MLNKDLIKRKVSLIETELLVLAKYKDLTFEETAKDFETQAIVERLLERMITRAIDINRHILTELGTQLAPTTKYRETFLRLYELDLYPEDFAKKIAPCAGFRNALVHDYNNIDKNILKKSIKKAIEEFNEYGKYILKFINKP